MFATSDWEPDVPKDKVSFAKKAVNEKKRKITSNRNDASPKLNKVHSKNVKQKAVKDNNSKGYNRNGLSNIKQAATANGVNIAVKNNFKKPTPIKKSTTVGVNKSTINNIATSNNNKHISKNAVYSKTTNYELKPKTNGEIESPSVIHTKVNNTEIKKKMKKNKKLNKMTNANSTDNTPLETSSGELRLFGNNPQKRKLHDKIASKNKKSADVTSSTLEIENFDTDNLDEVLVENKKKKLNNALKLDDKEDELFKETSKPLNSKKERLRKVLNVGLQRTSIKASDSKLRTRMLEKLKAAQFRYLNEKLYTSSGSDAQQLFQSDPAAFQTYHEGYQLQLKKWPVNPLDVIIKIIAKLPKSSLIADMGCGEAKLSKLVPHTVRSFDLVALAPGVETCDMARTPLLTASVDAAVYCLALMGTDLTKYLLEASRVLKMGGLLLIAEVESRFDDPDSFAKEVQRLGFKLQSLDKSHEVFFFMQFKKIQDPPVKKNKLPALKLKPCLYKRR